MSYKQLSNILRLMKVQGKFFSENPTWKSVATLTAEKGSLCMKCVIESIHLLKNL